MCFRNLPIEFDAQGHSRLKPGVADPYSYLQGPLQIKTDRERFEEMYEGRESARRIDVGRVTSGADGVVVVDVNALLELVDRGCAPELAVRIVAPLEWRAPATSAL